MYAVSVAMLPVRTWLMFRDVLSVKQIDVVSKRLSIGIGNCGRWIAARFTQTINAMFVLSFSKAT